MRTESPRNRTDRVRLALTGVLVGVACCLAVDRVGSGGILSVANAQVSRGTLANPLDQRKEMIEELRAIRAQLVQINARLEKDGVKARVVSMPGVNGDSHR